jgi:two-component system, NtrC family, response regulator AtoC
VCSNGGIMPTSFHGMVTASETMRQFFTLVQRVAATDSSVLIRGDTGTGKELVAQAIHELSARASGPFQAVNCATLTPEHLASELFGHVRGAFTGAVRRRQGLFALAEGGTLFLDEIAELPLELQGRLLRVVQEKVFVPLGGTEPVRVDLRLVAATHKALRGEVAAGRFREDLMYRIRVVPIFLPRLVEREGDVPVLLRHFIDAMNARGGRTVERVHPAALALLEGYDWPGNVRELHNVVEYAFAVGAGPELGVDQLTPEIRGVAPSQRGRGPSEADRILAALAEAGGNKSAAAALLGMHRTTLWRRLRELDASGT